MKKAKVNMGRLQLTKQQITSLAQQQVTGGETTVSRFTITRECELYSGTCPGPYTATCAESIGACTLNPAYSGC